MSIFDWFRHARPPRQRASARMNACPQCATALPDAARFCFRCGHEVDSAALAPARGGELPDDVSAELRARLAQSLDGRYRVGDVLGVGGMGVVFLADDLTLDRTVAIKVLLPDVARDANLVSRFRREAQTGARLDHPGIIPIYRVESEGGLHYFIMKYAAGRSLETVLRADAPLSIPFATRVLREAAGALAHAHRHGVVHRDVKPDNIMLDADERVILTDFGISKASSTASGATTLARLTEFGRVVGTPHYMAPEQALGQAVDGRADQYALAIVGFEMLAGRLPFDAESPHAIIHLHINEAPPRLAKLRRDVPEHLTAALSRALLKSPAHRFPTMEAFAAALGNTTPTAADVAASSSARVTSQPAGAAGKGAPTRVLAADDHEIDRALHRTFSERAAPHMHGSVSWVAVAILLLFVLGGTAAWVGGAGRGAARRVLDGSALGSALGSARASASPRAKRPSEGRDVRRPSDGPTVTQQSAAPSTRSREERRRSAAFTVASTPHATLFIDGDRVGETPVADRALTVGRTYRIRLERKGYRTKRETIEVTGTRAIHRRYVLERDSKR